MNFSRDEQPGKTKSSIHFYLPAVTGPATYILDQTANPRFTTVMPAYASYIDYKSYPRDHYITDISATGRLTIDRFDTTANIVSGSFDFTGQTESGLFKRVSVSRGRFDMRMEKR